MGNKRHRSFFTYSRALCLASAAFSLFLACASVTWAQSESINGTIRGRISDPSDQPVAGSNVTVVNNATGYTRSVASADDGYYVIASLPIGTYTVTITKDGFETLKFTEIVLQAGRDAVVEGVLKLGSVSTSIEVSGGLPWSIPPGQISAALSARPK